MIINGEKITYYCLTPLEINYIHTIMYLEARGEGYYGLRRVVEVLFNRMNDTRWRNDIRSVIRAENQFEPVSTGLFDRHLGREFPEMIDRALRSVFEQERLMSEEVVWFRAGHKGWHARALTLYEIYGAHAFYI